MVRKVGLAVFVVLLAMSVVLAFFGRRGYWVGPLVVAGLIQVVFRLK